MVRSRSMLPDTSATPATAVPPWCSAW